MLFTHILLPTDGSELSAKAVNGGLELAKALGARVTGYVCLAEYPYSPFSEYVLEAPATFNDRIQQEAQVHLDKLAEAAKAVGVPFRSDTSAFPTPYLGIIDAAERHRCDLILMASHGRRGLTSLLLGSETQRVLVHSKIPVLIYR
ncbi:universal stress protein, UspA family [Pandoraea thiooxydans]|nr:universal stress protein, UspA family [Pandoraea thiooxydans]